MTGVCDLQLETFLLLLDQRHSFTFTLAFTWADLTTRPDIFQSIVQLIIYDLTERDESGSSQWRMTAIILW
jgi:hypothetical protein